MMQIYADVLRRTLKIVRSDQANALGTAIFAAVAAGLYPTIEKAQEAMASGCAKEYKPSAENHAKYEELYKEYKRLGAYCESK